MDSKTTDEEKLRQNGAIFPISLRDQIITDILRIQSDGPKSVRHYNLKNQHAVYISAKKIN
ncbi:hypothetical protein T03_6112 [Trichinella britovi]|uniref:Uncharacterized protein n=1 Tax=Trichinella britovi TaxID=45882 RepID=A0A0V1BXT4_TRIBR|nr:hypothetical protein T03_6112 [Trichinella britovi]